MCCPHVSIPRKQLEILLLTIFTIYCRAKSNLFRKLSEVFNTFVPYICFCLAGAIMVTTPQDIALLDVRKGAEMFKKVKVKVNMSQFAEN